MTQISHEQTAKQLMDALQVAKSLEETRIGWRNYAKDQAWSRFVIPSEELSLVAGGRDAWGSQLELLSPQAQKDKRVKGNALN